MPTRCISFSTSTTSTNLRHRLSSRRISANSARSPAMRSPMKPPTIGGQQQRARPRPPRPRAGYRGAAAGEALADEAANDRWSAAARAAAKLKCTVLLKGVPTVIADLRGPAHVVASGNPGLATGGSGDLLAGFIGAFLARGTTPVEAAALGAHALGRAAELGARQWTARSLRPADVLAALPDVWRAWKDAKPCRLPIVAEIDAPDLL